MKTYLKVGEWKKNNGIYVRESVIYNPINPTWWYADDLYNSFQDLFYSSKQVTEEINRLRHKNKDEEPSKFVADISGLGQPFEDSHYSKDSKPISITLPDGTIANGLIRVSNHEADIGTFAKNHPNTDYCVSFVIGKTDRKFPDKSVPENRSIHIFEYVLEKKEERKERVLINIANNIIAMKKQGWSITTNIGFSRPPLEKTNKTKILKEAQLRKIIKIIIKKLLKT